MLRNYLSRRTHLLRYSGFMHCEFHAIFSVCFQHTTQTISPKTQIFIINATRAIDYDWTKVRKQGKRLFCFQFICLIVCLLICLFDWWIAVKIHSKILAKNIQYYTNTSVHSFHFSLKLSWTSFSSSPFLDVCNMRRLVMDFQTPAYTDERDTHLFILHVYIYQTHLVCNLLWKQQ